MTEDADQTGTPGATEPESYGSILEAAVDALASGRDAAAEVIVLRLSSTGSVAAVWDFDTDSRELICRHASLADLIDRRLALGVGVAGRVASHRRPAAVEDRRTDRRGDHYAGDLRIPPCGAAVPIPGGEFYTGGVLEVYGANLAQLASLELTGLGRLAAVIAAGSPPSVPTPRTEAAPRDSITDVERQNRRMAADLHDGVSQRLASLSFHLAAASAALAEVASEPIDAPDQSQPEATSDPVQFAARQLIAAASLTELAADDVRAAIKGLRPPVLDDLGLAKGLISLCGSLGTCDLAIDVDVEAVEPPLVSPSASLALYRVAQEALANAVKHAGVASVRVRLQRRGGNIVLDIRDDGAGYQQAPDGTAGPREPGSDGGLGLRSMGERMQAIGGRIELWSAPGRGTHVRAIVPE